MKKIEKFFIEKQLYWISSHSLYMKSMTKYE